MQPHWHMSRPAGVERIGGCLLLFGHPHSSTAAVSDRRGGPETEPLKEKPLKEKQLGIVLGRVDTIPLQGIKAKMGNSFSNISAFQSLHIVMLGLDSAGKTTVLYRLKFNEFVNTVPTIGFNTEKIRLSNGTAKGISCHFWDVGGQEKLRPLWKSYSRCTDGIIYVVDSVDVDRLEEAKTELHKVTKFAENQGTPLLVIANKQDLPKSLPVADIEKQLALHELTPSTTYHIQPACAIIGEGLHEGMDKLYEMIVKRRKSLKQKKKQR
ncbi:ADP-ribosylation factor-like protein 4C [Ilyodon furcidens]|uniref:ADP-ribosylation factor-like protein 4C n=5 Tax=Goodeidae TaxID=28758 RepID=A0ABV0SWS3_9TELE